jgi:lysophospholipase L1-like esterase
MRAYEMYVALGDSMSTDDYPGPGLGAASLLYRNRDDRFPEFAGQDLLSLNPGARLVNLARDGFTAEDVLAGLGELQPTSGPVLVTMTIGGNDCIHYLNALTPTCIAMGEFTARLSRILGHVRRLYRNLTLRMGNIYDPTDGTGRVQSGHDRFAVGLHMLGGVNKLLAQAAAMHGGEIVDVYSHFLGHGIRHGEPAYAHYHPEDPTGWLMRDIEPNPRGASELRRLFWRSLP